MSAPELPGWQTRAGLCLMRPRADAAPCIHCLEQRLHEAGFAPRGPLRVTVDAALLRLLDARALTRSTLHAPVLRIDGQGVVLHTLLAVPGCPQCAPLQRRRRLPPTRLPSETLLDPLLGITSCVEAIQPDGGEAALCHAFAGHIHTPGNRIAVTARGQAMTAHGARTGQLGEAVERYCALRPDRHRVTVARAATLPASALAAPAWPGFSKQQQTMAGHAPLDARRRIGWVPGQRLADGATRFVPAAAVYLSKAWWPDEPRRSALVSHGLAAHRSAREATDHAALELYERYRMTVAWHRRDFGLALDPRGLTSAGRALLQRTQRAGLQVSLMALAVPPEMPVLLALLWAGHAPWFMIGAAAAPDLRQAADSALLEACSGWQALVRKPDPPRRRWQLRVSEDARGHHRWYASLERSQTVVAALQRGTRPMHAWPRGRCTVSPQRWLLALSPDALVVPLETPDCAACGWHVHRVIAPGLPIYQFGRVGTPEQHVALAGLPGAPMPHPFR